MTTVERSRSSKAAAPGIQAGARRAPSLSRGTWRHSRVRFRPEPGGGPGGGRRVEQATRVLLVDDEQAIRTICRVNLESDGMEVVEAADGAQALELVRAESPSLVLLDVMMPDVDGWTAAETLLADPETKDIPVVFLSARAAPEDRLRAQKLGAVGYVVKPFDPLDLAATIRGILERIGRGEREQLNRDLSERD